MTEAIADTAEAPATEAAVSDTAAAVEENVLPEAPQQSEFVVPDAYKDKAWISKIKSLDDLWKQLDNTQSLVGKKFLHPDFDKATPEELEKFYSNVRPADKQKYAESLEFGSSVDDGSKEFFTDMLHKNGVHPKVANEMIKAYEAKLGEQSQAMYDKDAFMGILEKSFGAGYEKEAGVVTQSLKATLSPDDQAMLEGMPNEFVGLVYRLTSAMQKQYGANEGSSAAGKSAPVNQDYDGLFKSKMAELQALSSRIHTQEEKQRLVDELSEITIKRANARK